jgi:hypothetical protein
VRRDAACPLTCITLTLPTGLKKLSGADICRQGGARRKQRYLFLPPCIINVKCGTGGRLGEITKMDSDNPVLYLEWPEVSCTPPSSSLTYRAVIGEDPRKTD